jgi:serine/alanine adding enzyme
MAGNKTPVSVESISADNAAELPQSLRAMMGFAGLGDWVLFVRRIYGYAVHRVVARDGGKISGELVLLRIRHPLFGDYLTTAPFASYGGFAFASSAARDALLGAANGLLKELGCDHVSVRFDALSDAAPAPWVASPLYATYLVDLAATPEQMIASYSPDHRNHVRKSLRKGFSVSFGRDGLLDDAYAAIAASMHELGSPYHSRAYLRAMAEAMGQALEFAVVRDEHGQLVAGGVFISHGNQVTNLHANVLRSFRADYPGEFLYWSAIRHFAELGFSSLDLGRSLIGSGNEVFKMKWKPRVRPLAYWYRMKPGVPLPLLNQKNAKYRAAIAVWKQLPPFIVSSLGPHLIRGLA